jgi:hypothetical protein
MAARRGVSSEEFVSLASVQDAAVVDIIREGGIALDMALATTAKYSAFRMAESTPPE